MAMRVIMNSNPLSWLPCGTRTYTYNLLSALHAEFADLRLELFTSHAADMDIPGERTLKIWPEIDNLKKKLLWEGVSFPLATLSSSADLVHTPYHSTTVWTKQPSVMTVHDAMIWESPSTRTAGERVDAALLRRGAKGARVIITVSEYCKNRLVELLDLAPDRITVTPLAVGSHFTAIPKSMHEANQFAEKMKITKPYILFAGGNFQRKGILELAKAYIAMDARLRAAYELVLVGNFTSDDSYHHSIRDLASRPGGGVVHLPGILSNEDLAIAYRGATVFVFPSVSEGFGLPPLEAMSCGAPVIASNRASLPEVMGDAALFIEPSDVANIVATLASVLESLDLQKDLRRRSLERASHFSWAKTAVLTMTAYEQALS